jgi:hypothetical protein
VNKNRNVPQKDTSVTDTTVGTPGQVVHIILGFFFRELNTTGRRYLGVLVFPASLILQNLDI